MSVVADVLVVGAGPAGAAAAIGAVRAGRKTLVIDRASFPRDKCCGDGLTALALRELERMGVRPQTMQSWHQVTSAVVRSPSGREHVFPLPREAGCYAATARRAELDSAMLEAARSAGATVADGHALLSAAHTEDRAAIRARVEGLGTVVARWVIGADGMWSPLRKSLGLAPVGYRGEWMAFRQYFRDVGPRAAELVVWFEADLLPGYAWSFPLGDGRANVGFGVQRRAARSGGSMRRLWHDLLARPHIRAVLGPDAVAEGSHRAWPIPARVGRLPLASGRALFAGDAAGVSDPATGEGIGQALVTGRLAAEAVSGNERSAEAVASEYTRRATAELAADDRMSRALIPLLARPVMARGALRLAGASDWTRRNFARWLFEDYPRALVATPRRWRRGALSSRGAFAESA